MLTSRTQRARRRWAVVMSALACATSLSFIAAAPAAASTPRAKRGAITIKNFAFSPKTLQVEAGTTVKVSNKDGTTHTFTANKGAFDTGDIDAGSSATVRVKQPGTYAYHCNIHSSMKGTIRAT